MPAGMENPHDQQISSDLVLVPQALDDGREPHVKLRTFCQPDVVTANHPGVKLRWQHGLHMPAVSVPHMGCQVNGSSRPAGGCHELVLPRLPKTIPATHPTVCPRSIGAWPPNPLLRRPFLGSSLDLGDPHGARVVRFFSPRKGHGQFFSKIIVFWLTINDHKTS